MAAEPVPTPPAIQSPAPSARPYQRRIEANRRNAPRSTGPRTAEGKSAGRAQSDKAWIFCRARNGARSSIATSSKPSTGFARTASRRAF